MEECRSCGFSHKPEDLIDGQCPRWAPGDTSPLTGNPLRGLIDAFDAERARIESGWSR